MRKRLQRCPGRATIRPGGFAAVILANPRRSSRIGHNTLIWTGLVLLAPRPFTLIPDCATNFRLFPASASALRHQSLVAQAEPRPCLDELVTAIPQIPRRHRPSGHIGPRQDSTAVTVASPVIAPPPNPADPVCLSQEALRPCPRQMPLTTIVAAKATRLLHHGLVESTASQSWLGWCPGRLLS